MPCTPSRLTCREGGARHKGQAVQASEAAAEKGGGGGAAPGRAPPAPGAVDGVGLGLRHALWLGVHGPARGKAKPRQKGAPLGEEGEEDTTKGRAPDCSFLPLSLQGDAAPANAQEFEALLLSSPNSSFVWIKYMAFLISLGDIDRARAVAQRALETINYRCAASLSSLRAEAGCWGGEGLEGGREGRVGPGLDWTATSRTPFTAQLNPPPIKQGGRRAVQCVGGAAQLGEQLRRRGGHAEHVGSGGAARRHTAHVPGRHRRVPPLPKAGAAGTVPACRDEKVWRRHRREWERRVMGSGDCGHASPVPFRASSARFHFPDTIPPACLHPCHRRCGCGWSKSGWSKATSRRRVPR